MEIGRASGFRAAARSAAIRLGWRRRPTASAPVQDGRRASGKITRPDMVMPRAEQARLREAYAGARVILEYGAGGSTVMAAEMAGKTVTSVESDRDWAAMMTGWFAQNPPAEGSRVDVVWADVGPTKPWGYPADIRQFPAFPGYPLGVWTAGRMQAPDVVLVDGRFRVGCALATALMTEKPVALFFDDYGDREPYHEIEQFLGKPQMTGRLAHFEVTPMTLDKSMLLQVMQLMLRPF